jgi:hypothetical protein
MVDGSLRSVAEADAPQWDVVVGDRFIAMLAAPASEEVMAGLADLAAEPEPALERIVARIPTGRNAAVESFAVVWWPGARNDEVTALVRGSAVVDLASPGGIRRFDARGIRPFHLAEFGDVTAVRATGSDAPLWSAARAGAEGTDVGRSRATFRASGVAWSARPAATARPPGAPGPARSSGPSTDAPVTTRVDLEDLEGPVVAASVADRAGAAQGGDELDEALADSFADTIVSPRNRSATVDTVRTVRNRNADADTVLFRRRRPAWPEVGADAREPAPGSDPDSAPAAAGSDRETAASTESAGSVQPARHDAPHRAARPAAGAADVASAPRFRIGAGLPRSVTAPVRIGRNPAPPRVAPAGAELVRVDSPTAVISSTHLELRLEGRRLVAIDLRSTNGTVVRSPSGTRRMRSGESLVVAPGTSLDLGDDTIIEILPAPEGDEE